MVSAETNEEMEARLLGVIAAADFESGASVRVVGVAVPAVGVVRPNLTGRAEVFEDAAHFVVAGFLGVEVVEARLVVQWGDGASEV